MGSAGGPRRRPRAAGARSQRLTATTQVADRAEGLPAGAERPLPPIAEAVVDWQRVHGRHGLPWHGSRDPYRVWLSEIMLQQTQVTTVLAYYRHFLERFPDVTALAAASLDEVLALWSGLGYYSRARNLHRCAVVVVSEHGARFPHSASELAQLPGIGASTAAAIAAFCFDERVAILDGNVKRVLARLLAFEGDPAVAGGQRRLWAAATELLPEREQDMAAYTQGLMDLGATVCLARTPQCEACPLQAACAAHRTGRQQDYPVKRRRSSRKQREDWWLWLQWRDQVWLQQRPHTGVWAGLWTLPMFSDEASMNQALRQFGSAGTELPTIEHALTHFDWTLHSWHIALKSQPPEPAMAVLGAGRWVALHELGSIALPAPLSKLLRRPVALPVGRGEPVVPAETAAEKRRPSA